MCEKEKIKKLLYSLANRVHGKMVQADSERDELAKAFTTPAALEIFHRSKDYARLMVKIEILSNIYCDIVEILTDESLN